MRYSSISTQGLSLASSALFLLLGCAEPASVDLPPGLDLEVLGGDGQESEIGTSLAVPLELRVVDSSGVAAAGVAVHWAVTLGGGTVETSESQSEGDGSTTTVWTLGSEIGAQEVVASAGDQSVRFEAWAAPPPPEDWADVVQMRGTITVDGGVATARAWLDNEWAGTVRIQTGVGCLVNPKLLDSEGAVLQSQGTGCTQAVRMHTFEPSASRQIVDWELDVSGLTAGEYDFVVELTDGHKVNGERVTLPPLVIPLVVGS